MVPSRWLFSPMAFSEAGRIRPQTCDTDPVASGAQRCQSRPSRRQTSMTETPVTLDTDLFGPLAVPDTVSADVIEEAAARAAIYARQSRSENTRLAYRKAWGRYTAWCDYLGVTPLSADPKLVGMYAAAA